MLAIDIRGDLKPIHRAMVALRGDQVPFAMSLALNNLAKGVAADERSLIDETFDNPTPFTDNAYRIEVATKRKPVAIVAAKDLQAQYLAPYVIGGPRYLGEKRGMLVPMKGNIALNRYGNLTKGKLAALKAKPGVFIGPITFRKSGKTINGVWQRGATPRGKRYKGNDEYGTRGKNTNVIGGIRTTLKLLIRFKDTTEAPKHLDFYGDAEAYIRQNAAAESDAALRYAIATRRPK
jgi:hypothetical protein